VVTTFVTTGNEDHGRRPMAVFTPDTAGFDAFYATTSRALFRQLYAMCRNSEEAHDCLQEGYVRAWQRWDRVCSYDDPAAWVRTVAWRVAVSRWHRARRALHARLRQDVDVDSHEPNPDVVALSAALRSLPLVQRQAIVLHHLGGLSVEEISRQIGAPSGTVKARLARGRAALATLLEDGGAS